MFGEECEKLIWLFRLDQIVFESLDILFRLVSRLVLSVEIHSFNFGRQYVYRRFVSLEIQDRIMI